MELLTSLLIGLILGVFIGSKIVQHLFNGGVRPTTYIEDEDKIDEAAREWLKSNSL
ncbi:hypothetical protein [Siminovitchia sp. 179-K 8D1 HS]|uniref:hypothetical protein n=1 Tax=Siminovitchia sp. 179-K 8D1 HS TaxID=3142385 RepID=UPI0039A1686D